MSMLNEYQHQKDIHADTLKFLERSKFGSRDNGRTPFQWNNTTNAGFTTGTPWIKVNPNYTYINAASEESDSNSCLTYFKRLVLIRKTNLTFVYGKYKLLDKDNPNVYSYIREGFGKQFLILLNFTDKETSANINVTLAKVVMSNYKDILVENGVHTDIKLRPYESLICLLQ
jgi:oligo-1,6-glucosidase